MLKKGMFRNKELSIIIPVYNTPLNILDCTFKSIDSDLVDIIIVMVHTNDIIYDYKMRANSSSHQELSPESSLSIGKILESYNLMVEILKENDIYYDYKNKIDSIIVKLRYSLAICYPPYSNFII